MRTIGVVTGARSDYGIYLPVLRAIASDPGLKLYLLVSGMHLSPEFGMTVRFIQQDGFAVGDKVEMLLSSDSPEGIAKSVGLGIMGFAQSFSRYRPDLLVVLGDRFEMYAAAVAALPFRIPVAHIHGGELTFGAIDDALRHSITKLSHLHLVATEEYSRRVIQMGEEPWRVTVCGAPSLDNLKTMVLLSAEDLEARFGFSLARAPLLVTFHPVTLDYDQTERHMTELLAALHEVDMPVIFTMPNADTGGRVIIGMVQDYVGKHQSAWFVENLGTQAYFSLMTLAEAMVGNSSSGIVEAASFRLPVINIGSRQDGRVRAANVIDVSYGRDAVLRGLRRAIDPQFQNTLQDLVNPYGRGNSATKIVSVLREAPLNERLLFKRFFDVTYCAT